MVTIANLPAKTEAEIRYLIESGGYKDANEFVIETVHQLAQQRALADLQAKLQLGLDEHDRGESIPFTPELMKQIRAEAHELAISGAPLNPDVCGE